MQKEFQNLKCIVKGYHDQFSKVHFSIEQSLQTYRKIRLF